MPPQNIAIVGAGLAGLACAKTLAAYGTQVRLIDKGRGPGGRLATRRVEVAGQMLQFDHGAQYLAARGAGFAAVLNATNTADWPDASRRVGVPRISSVARALSDGLDLRLERHVTALTGNPGAWMLQHLPAKAVRPGRPLPDETPAEDGPFDAVVLAIPAEQAAALLAAPAPHLSRVLEAVRMAPCWTLMAAFETRPALPDTMRLQGGPLAWVARDSSKPGRDAATECWVAQASADWSRTNLERNAPDVAGLLLQALGNLAGAALPTPIHAAAHRWRHALVEAPLGAPCLWDASLGLGAAGDWCIAARAEAAVDSAAALAAAIRSA